MPKYPTQDPNYRILAHQRSRFTHYYFYIRDEVLGPIVMRVASFFPFHATYWLNGHSFIEQELKRAGIGFRKNDNAFLAVDDVAALQAAADRLSPEIIRKQLDYWTLILGPKFSKKERSQMSLSRFYAIAQIEYCRNFIFKRHFPDPQDLRAQLRNRPVAADGQQHQRDLRHPAQPRDCTASSPPSSSRSSTAITSSAPIGRTPSSSSTRSSPASCATNCCSNNLSDFGLKKGLDHLDAVRKRFQTITDRFAGFQAQCLNVHVDFPLLQRIALPVTVGSVRYPGIKIHDTRIIRLLEVLLHGGTTVGGWTAKQIHEAVLTTFQLSAKAYGLNQLRYDLRKLKGHGLLERDGSPLRLPPHRQRRPGRAAVPVLPQAALRSAGQQPLPPQARSRNTGPTANSKPPTTRPTRPSRTSLTCLQAA